MPGGVVRFPTSTIVVFSPSPAKIRIKPEPELSGTVVASNVKVGSARSTAIGTKLLPPSGLYAAWNKAPAEGLLTRATTFVAGSSAAPGSGDTIDTVTGVADRWNPPKFCNPVRSVMFSETTSAGAGIMTSKEPKRSTSSAGSSAMRGVNGTEIVVPAAVTTFTA